MNKLDAHKQLILDLRAQNESVRAIAAKVSEQSGEKIAPSTVQWAIKQWSNGNGDAVQIDPALILARLDEMEEKLGKLLFRRTAAIRHDIELLFCFGAILTALASGHWIVGLLLITAVVAYLCFRK